jgi:beta-lactamase regulating signal transducer with metallopeptidase domain/sugar lactone lactonase YvrE
MKVAAFEKFYCHPGKNGAAMAGGEEAMNWIGILHNGFAHFSAASSWALLLTKITLLLAIAWLIYFALARTNPRWRALLWRGVIVGLVLLAVGASGLPSLNIRIAAPAMPFAKIGSGLAPGQDGDGSGDPSPQKQKRELVRTALQQPSDGSRRPALEVVPHTAVEVRPENVRPIADHKSRLSRRVILLGIWGLGVALLLIRTTLSYRKLAHLLRTSLAVPEEILTDARQIAAALGCHCAVQAQSTHQYAVPFLYGMRRPVLVLPERMCQPEYRPQLPGIIAHELAHVRSRDFGWNIALQAISILLWFHPLVWRIVSAHRAACDAVCDAVSASHTGDVQAYCRTLARVALEGAASFPAAGLAMARSCNVRRRIAVLQEKVFAATLSRRAVVVVGLAGLLISSLLACVRLMPAMPAAERAAFQSPVQPNTTATHTGPVLPVAPEKPTAENTASQNLPQPGTITTYVRPDLPVDGALATTQRIDFPSSVAVDGIGGFYVSSNTQRRIYHVAADGRLRLFAGYDILGYCGNGELFNTSPISVSGLAVDSAGNLYYSDYANQCVRKVTPAGVITTIAGNGTRGYSGDGGPAASAQLRSAGGLAMDSRGNLYIADGVNHCIRKVTPTGIITTVAGNGKAGFDGEGGPATSAQLYAPRSVAVDAAGNLYIIDFRIRKVTPDGVMHTIAGKDRQVNRSPSPPSRKPFRGEGGPAASAQLSDPRGVAVDSAGNLYILDGDAIRKVTPNGAITTVAGNDKEGFGGDGGKAISAQLAGPSRMAVDSAGNLYIADMNNHRIRKLTSDGIINTVAGNGDQVDEPAGVAMDSAGNLYFSDVANNRIRKVTPAGEITTVAGNGKAGFSGDGGPATSAQLKTPQGVAVDSAGNLYIADKNNHRIRKVTPDGVISTIARAMPNVVRPSLTQIYSPRSIALDSAGNLYIVADQSDNCIHKVTPDGAISIVAGNGKDGFSGDGGPATSAQLNNPQGIAMDAAGNLYIADSGNARIRKVTPDGIISTIAGMGIGGDIGDDRPATSVQLSPRSVAVDSAGNLYIVAIRCVRKVTPDGIISTIAGNGKDGFSGDGGPATEARLSEPVSVTVDSAGNLYITDSANRNIRKVSARRKGE